MKTYIKSGFAAALIASATFAGSAMAQSTQYQPYAESPQNLDDMSVDRTTTGSIYAYDQRTMANTGVDSTLDRGDYYEGAMRPID